MLTDVIQNGVAFGDVAARLLQTGCNVNAMRPYQEADGRVYITVMENGVARAVPIQNVTATLRKDDWKLLDDAIVKAALPRLKAVADLRSAGLTFTIPQGMGKTVLETETQSDIEDADISMDGLRQGNNDRPLFELTNLPLPIIHKDFNFSLRQVLNSRNGGSPLDTTTAELAGRKVAESAEKLLLGVSSSYTYGGGTIYGYTNYPSRMTATMTAPTAAGWAGVTLLTELLAMRTQSQAAFHYGPYTLYNSPNWDQYLDNDYTTGYPKTTRNRIGEVSDFSTPMTLDYLTGFTFLMIQMTSDVIREVIGMDITSVQWETVGGMQLNFKVMAIMVPQLRADQNSRTGIVHGSA